MMEEKGIAKFPTPPHHRIPNYVGAEQAAKRLANLDEFQQAQCIPGEANLMADDAS